MVSVTLTPFAPWQAAQTWPTLALPASRSAALTGAARTSAAANPSSFCMGPPLSGRHANTGVHQLLPGSADERLAQRLGGERLEEVPVEARRERALAVGGLAVAGERDEAHRVGRVQGADALGHLVAAHPRQADVDDRDVGQRARDLVEPLLAARRDRDVVPPLREEQAHGLADVLAVVDHEHAPTRAGRAFAWRGHLLRGALGERQPQREGGAVSRPVALRVDPAAVQLRKPPRDGEPDAEPALRARERLAALDEKPEERLAVLGREPGAAVGHGDQRVRA